MIGDYVDTSIDAGYTGGDYTVIAVLSRPGRLRKLMRKLKIDKSHWDIKVIDLIPVGQVIDQLAPEENKAMPNNIHLFPESKLHHDRACWCDAAIKARKNQK